VAADRPAARPLRFRGVAVERHASLPSTNDEGFRRAAEGAPSGLVVATAHQTAGRGRMGRSWWDAPGTSVLASILLRPRIPLARYPLVGMAMACAVADAAVRLVPGERFDVKWPNDVLHRGRKFCGVLAETRGGLSRDSAPLVIGFGVNVTQDARAWPPEIAAVATSLRGASGVSIEPDEVLRATLGAFETAAAAAEAGDADALWDAVRPRLAPPGSPLAVTLPDDRVEGVVEGYEPTGALRLRDAGGAVRVIAAGEISIPPPSSEAIR
jgi:BirA family biotin operon repressor/biotin-[acetyl-CoA-carboxylase] ligase